MSHHPLVHGQVKENMRTIITPSFNGITGLYLPFNIFYRFRSLYYILYYIRMFVPHQDVCIRHIKVMVTFDLKPKLGDLQTNQDLERVMTQICRHPQNIK